MPRPPRLVSLYIRSCAVGFAAAAGFVGLLLWSDVGHLGHLILSSPEGWLALLMLWVFNGIVFSGVQFGIRIMAMAEPAGGTPRGPRAPQPVAIPVRADTRPPR